MKRFFLLSISLAVVWLGHATDALQQDLFSNYGGWVNLTAGYVRDSTDADPIKSEIAVSGNTVHLVFAAVLSALAAFCLLLSLPTGNGGLAWCGLSCSFCAALAIYRARRNKRM